MFDKFLSLGFLIAPLFYITRMPLKKAEIIFFSVFTAILFLISSFEPPKRNVPLTPIIYLLVIALIQLVIYDFSPTSATCVTNMFIGMVGMALICLKSDGLNRSMMEMMVLGGVINIFMVIGQHLGYSPIIINGHINAGTEQAVYGGIIGNGPRLGTYLALTLPFAFAYSWMAGILWLLAGVYIHQFPMFITAILMALMFTFHNNKFNKLFLLFPAALAIGFIAWQHAHIWQSMYTRFLQWDPIIQQVFQHPIFGCGLGTYPLFVNNFDEVAMSSLMEFLFNFGFVAGGIVLYLFIKDFIKNFNPNSLIQMSIIGLAVLCISEYPFEMPRLWPLIVAIGAFYLIEKGDIHGKTSYNS